MPFPELELRQASPPASGLSSRADVALFVGLVPRRPDTPVPADIRAWLQKVGWAGHGPFARSPADVDALLDVPVPIDSWGAFDALFAWEARPVEPGAPGRVPCPLGLAVRGFFAAGGVRAYVVRTGDPLPLIPDGPGDAVARARRDLLSWRPAEPPPDADARVPLIPGLDGLGTPPSAADPATWRGVAHAWSVEDAAMLALPDLPELFSGPPIPMPPVAEPTGRTETFLPCAAPSPAAEPGPRAARSEIAAPRLDRDGYRAWAGALRHVLTMLAVPRDAAHRRDLMVAASLPLPSMSAGDLPHGAATSPLAILDQVGLPAAGQRLLDREWLGSARLQLAYPWVETPTSAKLPEGLQAPEGLLIGTIARTALGQGAFRSAAGSMLPDVLRTLPRLGTGELRRGLEGGEADWLGDRLCLIGPRLGAFSLLSDATMAADRSWRAGGVSRLMGILLRAARWLGQDRLFEPSGPALWEAVRVDLETFLERLAQAGALAGAGNGRAYSVRCDHTTMSRSDIDAGRVVATVGFTAAQPIQHITVTLALGDSGGLSEREAA
jgi:hypothetical protein